MRIPNQNGTQGGWCAPPIMNEQRSKSKNNSCNLYSGRISVEIQSEKLLQLIQQRLLTASDLRCLDHASKGVLRELCLVACYKR